MGNIQQIGYILQTKQRSSFRVYSLCRSVWECSYMYYAHVLLVYMIQDLHVSLVLHDVTVYNRDVSNSIQIQ